MPTLQQLIPITIISFLLAACSSKDFEHCDGTKQAQASVSKNANGSISLTANGIDNVHLYSWRGPNKFYSNEQNPQISNPSAANAGKYTVDIVTKDGCLYTAQTDSIGVTPVTPSCNLRNNYMQLSPTYGVSFFYANGSNETSYYEVEATGSNYDLVFNFYGGYPGSGLYSIVPWNGDKKKGNVTVIIDNNGAFWYASGGTILVSGPTYDPTVTFCDVEFTRYTDKLQVSAKITF